MMVIEFGRLFMKVGAMGWRLPSKGREFIDFGSSALNGFYFKSHYSHGYLNQPDD